MIDEVRVLNDVRSATEIRADLKAMSVTNANLVGEWLFNGDYLDQTANNNDLTSSGSPIFSPDPAIDAEGNRRSIDLQHMFNSAAVVKAIIVTTNLEDSAAIVGVSTEFIFTFHWPVLFFRLSISPVCSAQEACLYSYALPPSGGSAHLVLCRRATVVSISGWIFSEATDQLWD